MGGLFGDAGAIDVRGPGGQRRAGRRGQRGFTLLELLITLSVTTIGLIGLLALHLSIARGNDGASRVAEAEQITTAALESLRAQNANIMETTITNTPTTTVTGRNGLPYKVARSYTVLNQVSTSLILVRVQTTWTEDGAAFGSGSAAAPLEHKIALEVIRTLEEQL
jgi:prepilin-type N-terminal cleavage/methylation domain-containing protein